MTLLFIISITIEICIRVIIYIVNVKEDLLEFVEFWEETSEAGAQEQHDPPIAAHVDATDTVDAAAAALMVDDIHFSDSDLDMLHNDGGEDNSRGDVPAPPAPNARAAANMPASRR